MDKIYVIGHKGPDTDTTVAAMSMAAFLNLRDGIDRYVPAMTGKANSETEFVFKRFNAKLPEVMADATRIGRKDEMIPRQTAQRN